MITYQDFERATDRVAFIAEAISKHRSSEAYKIAVIADQYDAQRNVTVNQAEHVLNASKQGAHHAIASNFFNRLNNQRCAYLLGNGVSFSDKKPRKNDNGVVTQVDVTKEKLGMDFDTALIRWGYYALIHGVAFGFWNRSSLMVFPITQFVPLWDEDNGALRAGIRYWQLDAEHPLMVELYEVDGLTVYRSSAGNAGWNLQEYAPKAPYITQIARTEASGVVAEAGHNYPGLPVIPMWGSRLKQSTLVGMRGKIDAYDMVQSGFADDLEDCAQIYWLIQNAGGMKASDLDAFLRDIREKHVAQVDTTGFSGDVSGALKPYVQDIPYQGRGAFLQLMRQTIYEDFGALDVHAIAASSTNDHIDAAYQPMDEQADLFEYQVIEAVQALLKLQGIEDTPIFKRNRVSNVKEQIEAVMLEANYLDDEAMLDLLPNITVDMKEAILARRFAANLDRLTKLPEDAPTEE